MKCIIAFLIIIYVEHPVVSAIVTSTISTVWSMTKDLFGAIIVAAFIFFVVLAIFKEIKGALASGIVG